MKVNIFMAYNLLIILVAYCTWHSSVISNRHDHPSCSSVTFILLAQVYRLSSRVKVTRQDYLSDSPVTFPRQVNPSGSPVRFTRQVYQVRITVAFIHHAHPSAPPIAFTSPVTVHAPSSQSPHHVHPSQSTVTSVRKFDPRHVHS